MVKRLAGAVTLGIGDGANDVGMIRAAHIGAATVSACSPGAWQAIAHGRSQ
jgi:magnesium-transporting ATPase (P-type)